MATDPNSATLHAEVPAKLMAEIQSLVDAGWFGSLDDVVLDALRRFVDSHRAELMEAFLQEDVSWGLHGRD